MHKVQHSQNHDSISFFSIDCGPLDKPSKKKRTAAFAGEIFPTKRPDDDNICKLCADALNGIGYHDDAQIVDLRIIKKYGESNEMKIILYQHLPYRN